jgi:tetratricopeptide (TPR) repeat protein
MRLLKLDDYPNFSLVEVTEDEVPRYAILSHTWGRDVDEVTYKDIIDGTGSGKAGYDKLHFCAAQAKNDRLDYCWIDTCCIDKTNAAELTESINSMFRWYQNASKCYVFLADVLACKSEDDRDSQLRNSRWFTRGWTLQELIAPRCVEFFSRDRERLGDRKSLEKQIYQIAGISYHALRGEPLSHFTIDERMSWTANRTTKRPEDKVYSLLGIFDIHMEAIYGEGEHHAYRRLLRELERYSEIYQLSELSRSQLTSSSAKIPTEERIWIVPFERNSRFTSREPELARLEEMLFGKPRTPKLAITGLGGVGKTQLVIEFLFRVADKQKDCSVFWFSAVNMESLHQSYLDVARQLSIPGCEDEKADVKRLVQEYLSKESTGRWLLVFDNADDIDMWITRTGIGLQSEKELRPLINYLPKSNQGAVLFTTRDRKIAIKLAQQNVVEVPAMGTDSAAQLLGKCLINADLAKSQIETSALLLQLTYLPLAIVQAAAYINENAISLSDYLSLLAEQEEEVIDLLSEEFEDDGRYYNIKNPVATTWLISFHQIQKRDRLAADYLSFMACIEPKAIPVSLLPPGASHKKEVDAIGTLTAYSFVNKRPVDEFLDLHRLVHLAIRNWLRKEDLLVSSTQRAVRRLEEVFPDHDHRNRTVWRKYLAHASHILEGNFDGTNTEARSSLLWKLGMCLYQEGRWSETERAFIQVMETLKRVLGPEHPSTLTSMNNLASTYWNIGRWDKAEELEVQVIEIRKRVLGPEHPDILATMNNLVSTYWHKGRWDEAEELGVQVMESQKRVLGPEHPDTLNSMSNLATTYRKKRRLDEAEGLEIQAIEISIRVLGKEHPDTLGIMSNLASTYTLKGQLDKAEELEVQVMEALQRVLGPDHPDTLTIKANLACTYREKRRWDEAEELEVQVMETRKRMLGPKHPDTLQIMANLALTYRNKGQWDEAECLAIEAMETRKTVLGLEHPDTLASMLTLASTYTLKGRWDEAEELEIHVIETQKRVIGPENPATLISYANLASTYEAKGRWDEAEELEVQTLEISKRVLGPEHPDTLTSMDNLVATCCNIGRWDKAEGLGIQVTEIRKRVHGEEHPSTLISLNNLALMHWEKGRRDEAEELLIQILEIRRRVLGLEHPDTLVTMANLSFVWKAMGKKTEALSLREDCVKLRRRVLGENHPTFLSSAAKLKEWRSEGNG